MCLIEKGSSIGAHILSGNVFQPTYLNELLSNWKEEGAPLNTPVKKDTFKILFQNSHINIPGILLPKAVHNEGNYIISLGDLCAWMGQKAEELGVEILPGLSGDKVLYSPEDKNVV